MKANLEPHPTFGPHPSTQVANFSFEGKVENLSFKLNLGDISLDKDHEAKFIDLICSNMEVFYLHDKDLGNCDWLTHMILTSTDKPMHLPDRTILRQFQGEVHKCLNNWLGIFTHLIVPILPSY